MLARTFPEDFPINVERPSPGVIVLPKGSSIIIDVINTCKPLETFCQHS